MFVNDPKKWPLRKNVEFKQHKEKLGNCLSDTVDAVILWFDRGICLTLYLSDFYAAGTNGVGLRGAFPCLLLRTQRESVHDL